MKANIKKITVEVQNFKPANTYMENGIVVTVCEPHYKKSTTSQRRAKGQRQQSLQRKCGLPGYVLRAA